MARGIEARDIFNDDDDWGMFLLIFSAEIKQAVHRCYAWALLPAVSYALGTGEKIEKKKEIKHHV
jgi:hypothetical protein